MSTNINITVGDNALLDRAKQQQTANRQAQLNRENSTRLEAQATDERTKAQAASGKDVNGNPLYGVPTPTPQIDRRPAANRQETTKVGHAWQQQTPSASYDTTAFPGLMVSGGGNSTTVGTNFFISTGQIQRVTRAGTGIDSENAQTFQYTIPAPSMDGYEWNPTRTAFFQEGAFGTAWFPYAYGPRTMRWAEQSYQVGSTLALPAGKDSFVLLVFCLDIQYSVDVTAAHFAVAASVGGDINNPPSQAYIDAAFASLSLPGAEVSIGYATDNTGSPVHPFDLPSASVYQREGQRANLAFLCTNTSIKPINVSSKLNDFMEWANPQPTTKSIPIKLFYFDEFSVEVPDFSSGNLAAIASLSRNAGFVSQVSGPSRYTPQIYQTLNTIYPYADPSDLIDYEDVKYRLSTDTRTGTYSVAGNRYESALPFNYAKNDKTRPESELGRKVFSLLLNPARPSVNINFYYGVWDWDNPAYCKARLADLGISSADLVS